jgi:hypothetical protein
MKGGWKFQPLQHLGGEKSSQTNAEKNRSTTLGLSRYGGEELELAGVALVNGSGGRRKTEVQALYCPGPLVQAGVTPAGTKGRGAIIAGWSCWEPPFCHGSYYEPGLKGGWLQRAFRATSTEGR